MPQQFLGPEPACGWLGAAVVSPTVPSLLAHARAFGVARGGRGDVVMAEYTIEIPGELRGKARPRVLRSGHSYTPQQTVSAENWIKACAVEQGVMRPLLGPLGLCVEIERAVPPSWSKKKRAAALAGEIKPTGKPDLDNVVKLLGDALNKIAWDDDSQIVTLTVVRIFSERSRAEIKVVQL
jgi:Holliday junction resolvase RusA-like endonuclease